MSLKMKAKSNKPIKNADNTQTILSMFKRQNTKTESSASGPNKAVDEEDDDDVVFMNMEEGICSTSISSPYFQRNNPHSSEADRSSKLNISKRPLGNESKNRSTTKKRKLSLIKTKTELTTNTDESKKEIEDPKEEAPAEIIENNTNVNVAFDSVEKKSKERSLKTNQSQSNSKAKDLSDNKLTSSTNKEDRNSNYFEGKDNKKQFSHPSTSEVRKVRVSSDITLNTDEGSLDADIQNDIENKTAKVEPYYFNNFETILATVVEDTASVQLFDEDDMAVINKFKSLSDDAKKVFIRIFCRKAKWIPRSKLNYPEIDDNLQPHLNELVKIGFLYDDKNMTDLREVLDALTAADIKALAKVYHVPNTITQKSQQVEELIKQTQRTNISHMFGAAGGQGGLARAMLTRAKKFLNGVYKLCETPRTVFVRVIMLFSVVNTSIDEENGVGGQGQLFQMLMVNMGKVVYPVYDIDKAQPIFGSRDDVLRFSQALQLESDLLNATDKGRWDEAFEVFNTVQKLWETFEADQKIVRWNKLLPGYLRSFTATSVLYRLLSQGIEILQRRKDFNGAVDLLRKLLAQEDYCCSHRGYWWERLALNLDAHLKKPEESLEAALCGLADPHVRVGHRLALYQRGQSICQRPKSKLVHRLQECLHPHVRELPKVHIEGRVLHGSSGLAPRFLTGASYMGDADGGVADLEVCGVEEFVLDYYQTHGYPSGIHAEGSVVTSLFALFFWDILFMSKPDAFHSPYQAMPLDLYTDSFYERREVEIDDRITKIASSSVEELQDIVKSSWEEHEGVMCVGMNWERMRSAECVMELVACMGPQVLSGVLKRYAHCPRHTRSGFPDLTLWNLSTHAFKICEVKGPGDRLSHKQILWINYLLEIGVDAEVCHVKAVAAKRLIRT